MPLASRESRKLFRLSSVSSQAHETLNRLALRNLGTCMKSEQERHNSQFDAVRRGLKLLTRPGHQALDIAQMAAFAPQ